jgi:hypothetical protein
MNDAAHPDVETPAAERARMLRELAQIGMEMARDLGRDAAGLKTTLAGCKPLELITARAELTRGFAQVSRAVRMTLGLEARLEREALAPPPGAGRSAHVAPPRPRYTSALDELKDRLERIERARSVRVNIERAVELAIERESESEQETERLRCELHGRVERCDAAHLALTPFGEVVLTICRDLGLNPDLSIWGEEPWAVEEAKRWPAMGPAGRTEAVEAGP